jgi:ribosomal-protein-alanine N-acetyltransferase
MHASPPDPDFPTLLTPRLRLREIVANDAPALFAIHSDDEAMRWFGTNPMVTLEETDKLIESFAAMRRLANPGTRWALELRDGGELIGTCGLFKWNRGWHSCSLGYELGRLHWGQGLMHEALTAVLDWGFDTMELNRVEAQVHPANTHSIRRLQALGFQPEGLLRQAGYWLGSYHDLLAYALLRDERYQQPTPSTP